MDVCGNILFLNIISHFLLLRAGSSYKREVPFPILNFGNKYDIGAPVNTTTGIMLNSLVSLLDIVEITLE